MSTQSLSNILTIVIPSKNENKTLYRCIEYISTQNNIQGTRIIIADVSDNEESIQWIKRIKLDFKDILSIDTIKGGYPAEGRLYGSLLVRTKYMLFLDADIFLTNPSIIDETISYDKGLTTVQFHTDYPYGWVFRIFDIFQNISVKLGTPFAVGGFQLWDIDTYWMTGGYNPRELFAEDYSISHKVDPKDFKVAKVKGTYTSSRRFKNKGVLWMFYIMIKSFLNRNNPEFFLKSHGYWD
jgi:glycosyltransferase involved in cell wall biosynthesis